MPRPFKFRYVNEITGFFVFLAITLLCIMLFFTSHAQGWFEPKIHFYTVFSTKEGSFGLQSGADVIILSTIAGSVNSILPKEDGNIEGKITIKEVFHKYIRSDSNAIVKKKFGLAGDAYLEILAGDPKKPLLKKDDYITTTKDTEIIETIKELMEDFRKSSVPVIEKLQQILAQLPPLMTQVQTTFKETEITLIELRKNFLPLTENINVFSRNLPEISDKLNASLSNINNFITYLTELLNNIKNLLNNIKSGQFSEFVNNLPELESQLEQTLLEFEKTLAGFQKHWLIRKYVEKDGAKENILPFEIVAKDTK